MGQVVLGTLGEYLYALYGHISTVLGGYGHLWPSMAYDSECHQIEVFRVCFFMFFLPNLGTNRTSKVNPSSTLLKGTLARCACLGSLAEKSDSTLGDFLYRKEPTSQWFGWTPMVGDFVHGCV
jgi:hypothetical protein